MIEKKESCLRKLCVHVALAAEARPLINAWRLQAVDTHAGMACYKNRERDIVLMVSGVGKISAAMATSMMLIGVDENIQASVLSVGIAGHLNAACGSLWRVDQVLDQAAKRNGYPGGIIRSNLNCSSVETRDCFSALYPKHGLVDMEAAGVYAAATRFVTREQVEILKIVSDNTSAPIVNPKKMNATFVSDLITKHIPDIDRIGQDLLDVSAQESAIKGQYQVNIDGFLQRWHFTVYQQRQLQRQLRAVRANYGAQAQSWLEVCNAKGAAEIFALIKSRYN